MSVSIVFGVILVHCFLSEGVSIETYRELWLRWKQAEKGDRFLGKTEGESSFPVVYLPCYHVRLKTRVFQRP